MKRLMKIGIVPLILIFTFLMLIGIQNSLAQQYFNFSGKVVSLYRGSLSVQGDKGETMKFAVGRRTIYIPSRLPGVGERVKITYYFSRGHNVGYQVEIVPPPSSPPSPPPPKKK
ncbi:MAG: hypothetical protein A2V86_05930 [Deltaproteobacteria bacterium RBG_16_49_23]|nr:MAG: hypothetical protein A2V86_05930 [Deltaproteobacteria bacterium RBG_16_49_23]